MRMPIAAIAALLATSALACETPYVSIDADSNARWSEAEPVERGMMEQFAGPAPSDRHILVIDQRNSTTKWIGPENSPNDIAIVYGINSYLYAGSQRCHPPGMPIDPPLPEDGPPPEELPPGKPPIELFPDEPLPGIQPRSGLWQARLGKGRLEGCPAIMQQAFQMSPNMYPAEWMTPRRLNYKVPFHPDQLEMTKRLSAEGLSNLTWHTVDDDAWRAEVFHEIFGQIPSGEGGGSKMTWQLRVKSETEIEHISTVHFVLPAEAAAVMGGSLDCRMTSVNSWVRVGD